MLVRTDHLLLRLTTPGRLVAWEGLALRGLLALHFKSSVCRQPAAERATRWQRCSGCPHVHECPYGQTFEPDPPPGVETFRGQEDAARPLVLAPHFPLPERGEAGLELPLRLISMGPAVAHADAVREHLRSAPRQGGLGPDRVRFAVRDDPSQLPTRFTLPAADLPPRPDALPGRLPRVGVGLTSPLLLKQRGGGQRREVVLRPRFGDLFRASLRTVGRLFAQAGEPLDADFRALADAAEAIQTIDHCYEPFEQPTWSSRRGQHRELLGVVGGALYGDVPLSLLPWLLWGGRFHVGSHRIAGAGGWRLVLD
jgi:hypothetical protein